MDHLPLQQHCACHCAGTDGGPVSQVGEAACAAEVSLAALSSGNSSCTALPLSTLLSTVPWSPSWPANDLRCSAVEDAAVLSIVSVSGGCKQAISCNKGRLLMAVHTHLPCLFYHV